MFERPWPPTVWTFIDGDGAGGIPQHLDLDAEQPDRLATRFQCGGLGVSFLRRVHLIINTEACRLDPGTRSADVSARHERDVGRITKAFRDDGRSARDEQRSIDLDQ